jgi:hypothetical protein
MAAIAEALYTLVHDLQATRVLLDGFQFNHKSDGRRHFDKEIGTLVMEREHCNVPFLQYLKPLFEEHLQRRLEISSVGLRSKFPTIHQGQLKPTQIVRGSRVRE